MTELENKINNLRNEIFEIQAMSSSTSSKHLAKLTKIEKINKELKETIILLHSNTTAEMQALKTTHIKLLTNLLDVDKEILQFYKDVLKEVEVIKEKRKSKLTKLWDFVKFPFLVLIVVTYLWVLNYIDTDVTDKSISQIKELSLINSEKD